MQKEPDAFRTISEVASELEVPQHVLRFWETRFSQIRPMKRAGGRRYYRPQDVDLLRGIRQLLYEEGYTIKGVQKILREHGIAHVIAIGRGEIAPMPAMGMNLSALSQQAGTATQKPEKARTGKEAESPGEASTAADAPRPAASALDETALSALREALAELERADELLRSVATQAGSV